MSAQYPTPAFQEANVAANDYPHTREEVEEAAAPHAAESRQGERSIAQRVLGSGAGQRDFRDDCNPCADGSVGVVDTRNEGVQPITTSSAIESTDTVPRDDPASATSGGGVTRVASEITEDSSGRCFGDAHEQLAAAYA